jgi:hypothetical protein
MNALFAARPRMRRSKSGRSKEACNVESSCRLSSMFSKLFANEAVVMPPQGCGNAVLGIPFCTTPA